MERKESIWRPAKKQVQEADARLWVRIEEGVRKKKKRNVRSMLKKGQMGLCE